MSHYPCVRVFLTEDAEELTQGGFLLGCAVVRGDNLLALSADAADVGDVDGGGVIASHTIAHFLKGEHLMGINNEITYRFCYK